MGKLEGTLKFTGKLGDFSVYKRCDSDDLIIRTKGGATKRRIKKDPAFAITRNINSEWSGATKLAGAIRRSLIVLTRLADYNISGPLNSITNMMRKADEVNEFGKRDFSFSMQRNSLNGFNFNQRHPFDSVVRVQPTWQIDRDTQEATVTLPELISNLHINNFTRLPYFRFVVMLGNVSDMVFDDVRKKYIPTTEQKHGEGDFCHSEWVLGKNKIEEQILHITPRIASGPIDARTSLILGIGIEFGTIGTDGKPESVKYGGCAKILGIV